jgi:hypothetical protein
MGSESSSDAAIAMFREQERTHPLCIELAFSNAVIAFFSSGFGAGMTKASAILKDVDKYYSVRCFDILQVTALRALVERPVKLSPREYVEFLFLIYFVREKFQNDNLLYDWIDSEWRKRESSLQYNELFLLRNMVWSLTRGLVGKYRRDGIEKRVSAMDASIVRILRVKFSSLPTRNKGSSIAKIAICCGLMKHDYRSLHAALVFDYARNLAKVYPELTVSIVVTNEMPFRWAGHAFWMNQLSDTFAQDLQAEMNRLIEADLRERIEFIYMPLANGSWQDLGAAVQTLVDINPDVLMFYGAKFYNESWFVRKALFGHYPVAYFFSQMNNEVDEENDVYLVRNDHRLLGAYDPSRTFLAPPAVRADVVMRAEERTSSGHAAGNVKRKGGEVIIVTALAGTRMASYFARYEPSVRKEMMSLLDVPGVRWIWVGPVDPEKVLQVDPDFRAKHAEGKLEIRKFEPNLEALFDECDLMLHLPRFTGGGGGLILALMRKLPILCFRNTDSSTYVLPECVFAPGEEAKYFRRAQELVRAPDLLPELGRRAASYYAKHDVDSLARLTYQGLQRAVQSFNKRVGNAVNESA